MSEQIRTPEQVERNAGIVAVLSTIGILVFLAGLLAYTYPEFLPAAPEKAVRLFLRAEDGDTWFNVQCGLQGTTRAREDYILAASRVDLAGYRVTDSVLKRTAWALGRVSDRETLKVTQYYRDPQGQLLAVPVNYVLLRVRGQWYIDAESVLDGGYEQYLRKRGRADV